MPLIGLVLQLATSKKFMLIILFVISNVACHRVTESTEDIPPDAFKNTTTLYPISKNTTETPKDDNSKEKNKINAETTAWKLETAFAESEFDKKVANITESIEMNDSRENSNSSKDFKPSTHLGTFFEEENLEVIPTKPTFGDFRPLKKPPTGFFSSPKDHFKSSIYHTPKEVFRHEDQFPYKIENNILTKPKNWRPEIMDSRPTIEAPIRVPAGGLYKSPDAFKDKPGTSGDSEDFGLTFDDVKDNNNNIDIKKRVNPWQHLLRMITAFIPVGIIISALTPNIITVQSTGPDSQYPGSIYRRSDASGGGSLDPISEACRRRLLCELHSDKNYMANNQNNRPRRGRQCYRLHCEDPEALANMLQWLLTHQRNPDRHDT